MVSIALVDARKTSLTGVQNSKKKIGSPRRWSPLRHLRGFKIAKKNRLAATMVSIALVDARKTSLTGVQNSQKKIGSPLRGSWTMVSIALVDARKISLTGVQNSKKIGSLLRGSWTMVSIALVDARKTSLMGVQNSKKNRLAATRLVDDAPHRRWVKPPPPLGKKLDPPLIEMVQSENIYFR